jgi:protein-disulfide isomerase
MRVHGVLAVAAALVGGFACADAPARDVEGTERATRELLAAASVVAEPDPQTLDISQLGMNRGAGDAPVRIIEFSDYGCGYCRKFHEETWPVVLRDFVDTGKVEWKFLPFVSGMFGNTTAASTAAECVLEQGDTLFHAMNGLIWMHQSDWKRSADPDSVLRGLANESGAELPRYDTCLSEGRRTQRVEGATSLARDIGVRGSPTFFVVGYPPIQGALPTDAFVQILTLVYNEAIKPGGTP